MDSTHTALVLQGPKRECSHVPPLLQNCSAAASAVAFDQDRIYIAPGQNKTLEKRDGVA